MKKVVMIGSYCNTPEKMDVLERNIDKIKSLGSEVAVYSPLVPLSPEIIKKCDIFIYSKENPVSKWPDFFFNFFFEYRKKIRMDQSRGDFGWAGIYQIKKLSEVCLTYDYDRFYFMVYDTSLEEIENIILEGKCNEFYPYKHGEYFTSVGSNFISFNRENLEEFSKKINFNDYCSIRQAEDYVKQISHSMNKMALNESIITTDSIRTYSDIPSLFNLSPIEDFNFFFDKDPSGQRNVRVLFFESKMPKIDVGIQINDEKIFYGNFFEDGFLEIENKSFEIKKISLIYGGKIYDITDKFNSFMQGNFKYI